MTRAKKNNKNPESNGKIAVKSLQKNLKAAKEAAKVNKVTGRRSTSIISTPEDDTNPLISPGPLASTSTSAEAAKGPTHADDIFDTEMSGTGTPPATEMDPEEIEFDSSSEDSRRSPTPTATENRVNSAIPGREEEPNHAPRGETPISTPEIDTPVSPAKAITAPLPPRTPTTMSENQTEAPMTGTQSTAKPTTPPKPDGEDEYLKEVHQLMRDSSKAAPTGEFRRNVKIFSPTKEGPETAAPKSSKPRIEWEVIKKDDLTPELQHASSNNLDMMSEELINECAAAAEGRPHNLGYTSQILVEKGFKWLFKLMTFTIPKEKQPAWITHSIRSVLSLAGVSLSSMLATVDLCEGEKNQHQWTLVSFTKEAYDAFAEIRLLFDPRSQSAVSVREWTMDPPRTQIFSIGAVVTPSDSEKEAADAVTSLEETIVNLVKDQGVTVTRVAMAITPRSGKVTPVNVHLRIDDKVEDTFFISPTSFKNLRVKTPKGTRVSSCRFGRLCPNCASDSHVETKECPWITYKCGTNTINFDVPKDLIPGRTVEPKPETLKKRKRSDQSDDETPKQSALPKMRDARPKFPPTKKQKTSDPKGKGRAVTNDENETE
jgi:hypothetical protein